MGSKRGSFSTYREEMQEVTDPYIEEDAGDYSPEPNWLELELESDQDTVIEDEPVLPAEDLLPTISKEFDEVMLIIQNDVRKTLEVKAKALHAMQAIQIRITEQKELLVHYPDYTSPKQSDVWEILQDLTEVRQAVES